MTLSYLFREPATINRPLRRVPCHPASGVNTPSAAIPMERNAASPASFARPSALHRWTLIHVEFLTQSHTKNVKSILQLSVTVLLTGYYDWSRDTSRWQQEDYTLWHRHDQMYLLRLLSGGLSCWCYCSGTIRTMSGTCNSVEASPFSMECVWMEYLKSFILIYV